MRRSITVGLPAVTAIVLGAMSDPAMAATGRDVVTSSLAKGVLVMMALLVPYLAIGLPLERGLPSNVTPKMRFLAGAASLAYATLTLAACALGEPGLMATAMLGSLGLALLAVGGVIVALRGRRPT